MIDSRALLAIWVGRCMDRKLKPGLRFPDAIMQTLALNDGKAHIADIFASFLYNARKWKHAVHLYLH